MPGRGRWGRVLSTGVCWSWCRWLTNCRIVLGRVGSLHTVVLEVAPDLSIFLSISEIARIKGRLSYMIGKTSTTEPCPQLLTGGF